MAVALISEETSLRAWSGAFLLYQRPAAQKPVVGIDVPLHSTVSIHDHHTSTEYSRDIPRLTNHVPLQYPSNLFPISTGRPPSDHPSSMSLIIT